MTEREALETICWNCNEKGKCELRNNDKCKSYQVLRKSIDILNTFRSHTKMNALGDIVCDTLFGNISYPGWEEHNKEYKRVKEWLENDK